MLKKIWVLIIVMVLCMPLAACGRKQSNTTATTTMENSTTINQDNGSVTEMQDESMDVPSEIVNPEPDYLMVSRPIGGFETTFSEGRAWVKYFPEPDTNTTYSEYGLIDENGYVYLCSDLPGSKVSGGYTVLEFDNGFDIYDQNGNCTYYIVNTPEYQLTVIGSGDGYFPVIEHSTGFAGNTYSLTAINAYGEFICSKYPLEKSTYFDPASSYISMEYLGEGIFYCYGGWYSIFNVPADCYLQYNNLFSGMSPFFNGQACAEFSMQYLHYPTTYFYEVTVTPADLSSEEAFNAWISQADPNEFMHSGNIGEMGGVKDHIGEGYIVSKKTVYDPNLPPPNNSWNIPGWYISTDNGQFVAEFPTYPDGVEIKSVGVFSGGYLPLILQGADKFYYFTLLDTDGNQMYEPVCPGKDTPKMYNDNYVLDGYFSCCVDGNIFFRTYNFTGEKGFARIDVDGNITYFTEVDGNLEMSGVDSDYVYFNRCVTDHEGNIVLNSVSYPEYEAEVQEPDVTVSKDYVNPSSYTIEGKWKSIGNYGFGQAQPGAIVSFDGVHCNLYSPSDTYAFYKNGDRFILDCTSVLSGTVSFTVKIVDGNHIDLYNGGYVTELSRVD